MRNERLKIAQQLTRMNEKLFPFTFHNCQQTMSREVQFLKEKTKNYDDGTCRKCCDMFKKVTRQIFFDPFLMVVS